MTHLGPKEIAAVIGLIIIVASVGRLLTRLLDDTLLATAIVLVGGYLLSPMLARLIFGRDD